MEVYTCDSVSYVICRNLAFLMLDLETQLSVIYAERFTFSRYFNTDMMNNNLNISYYTSICFL